MLIVDQDTFFKRITRPIRPLNEKQVANLVKIIKYYDEKSNLTKGQFSSLLAQIDVESAHTFDAIRERGGYNYFRYLIGKLGIRNLQEAWLYRGFGKIQVTGRSNFIMMDEVLTKKYGFKILVVEVANGLNSAYYEDAFGIPMSDIRFQISLDIAFIGCERGLFTGKKLSDYISGEYVSYNDFYNARKVVNPDELKARPTTVAQIANNSMMIFNAIEFKTV